MLSGHAISNAWLISTCNSEFAWAFVARFPADTRGRWSSNWWLFWRPTGSPSFVWLICLWAQFQACENCRRRRKMPMPCWRSSKFFSSLSKNESPSDVKIAKMAQSKYTQFFHWKWWIFPVCYTCIHIYIYIHTHTRGSPWFWWLRSAIQRLAWLVENRVHIMEAWWRNWQDIEDSLY